MKKVKEFFLKNIKQFEEFCESNKISTEKALSMPWCYTEDELYIQTYDRETATNGLKGNTPAPILIVVHKINNSIGFELTEKGKEVLSV